MQRRPSSKSRIILLVVALLAMFQSGYLVLTTQQGGNLEWDLGKEPLVLQLWDGFDSWASGEPHVENPKAHLITALSEWVRTSSVVATTGTTPEGRAGLDGINLVTIAPFPENSGLVGDSIAVSSIWTLPSDGIDRVIEADVVLNPDFELGWTTLPTAPGISLQEIALHEFGHVLGLKHTVSRSAKMFLQVHFGGPQRSALTWDDISGISTRYPLMGLEQITGSITGRVTKDGEPVFGAFVIAVDSNGTCESSAITGPDGTYAIEFLPPGWYTLYAEPLDGPTTPFGIADHFFSPSLIDTDFVPTFAYDSSEALTQVSRNRSTSGADIEVQPGPTQVDPEYLGTADSPYAALRVTSSPAKAHPGSNGHLVAAGTEGVEGLLNGSSLQVTGTLVSSGRLQTTRENEGGTQFKIYPLNVSPEAPLGSYSLLFQGTGTPGVVTGGLEVTPLYGYLSGFAHSVHLHEVARSEVFIINPHLDRPVSGRIGFRDEAGREGTMQLTGLEESEGEWKNFRLEPGASLFASTSESSSFRGSAHVESDEPLGAGLLVNTEHGTTGTASVPASYSFVAPVEVLGRGTRSNTGIALSNLDHRPAEVILFLQDRFGKRWGQEVIQLEGGGQTARFVGEWIPVPEDFTGTLLVTANRLITGTAIRTQPGVFTTYPVLQSRASTRTTFAHFARSGDFSSRLLLINPSPHLAADNVTIRFRSATGTPAPVTLNSVRHPSGQLTVSIPPLGIRTLRATDTDLAGWVEVESQIPVGGVVLFGSPEVGTAGVGESHPAHRQVLGIDRDVPTRVDTGIALANTTAEAVTLILTVRDQAGQTISESAELVLQPFEQIAHFPDDQRLGLQIPPTFRGALWIEANGECAVTAIRQSPGVLTTFPALVLE